MLTHFARTCAKPRWGVAGVAAAGTAYWSMAQYAQSDEAPTEPETISNKKWTSLTVISALNETHNVQRVTLSMPHSNQSLSSVGTAPICNVLLKADIKGETVVRPYNPVTSVTKGGQFDILVKEYPGGKMSGLAHKLRPGDTIDVKGPNKQFGYTPNKFSKVGMVAGGTGITPMMQLLEAILENPEDKTEVTLLFANKTPHDILCKARLDELQKKHPDQFKVKHIIETREGRISEHHLKNAMPPPKRMSMGDIKIFVCGRPGFTGEIAGPKTKDFKQGEVQGMLGELGYTSKNVWKL